MCNQFRQLYYIYKSKIMKRIVFVAGLVLLGSFTAKKFKMKKENLVYIPAGTFEFEDKKVSVNSFYMSTTEVTNKEYLKFVNDLKRKGNEKEYLIALPDTMNWRSKNAYNVPYVEHYFRHPAYSDYPVVNITKEAAELYCVWYTKQMLVKFPKSKFNDFRLPSKEEWVYAAKGGLKNSPYPWGGPFTHNVEGKHLANFLHIGEHNIKRDSLGGVGITKGDEFSGAQLNNAADILAPSKSFNPNGYGLYNMAGNAAEFVARDTIAMGGSWKSTGYDIRVSSESSATDAKPTIGFRMVSTFTGTYR